MVTFDDSGSNKRLAALHEAAERKTVARLASELGLEHVTLGNRQADGAALRQVKRSVAEEHLFLPYNLKDRTLTAAVRHPDSPEVQKLIEDLQNKGFKVTLTLTDTADIKKALHHYDDLSLAEKSRSGGIAIASDSVAKQLDELTSLDTVKEQITAALNNQAATSRLLELCLSGALSLGASDIHFEPEEKVTRLRYRLDGELRDIASISNKVYSFILSRVILISGLKLNLAEAAQDGRFSITLPQAGEDKEVEMRVSIIPGSYQASIVMRILDPDSIRVELEQMGYHPDLLTTIKQKIAGINGMILNTGPTGSGKTTSLYAFLRSINKPDIKIITIEDPVEYHLRGIVQTQVDKDHDYTFLSGLRSALRQDPDVVMVGEIRDPETAEVAVNAALTGHIVFSTLHTNSCFGTIPRFTELGVNPKTLASALSLTMAQRLVRNLCTTCREKVPISTGDKPIIEREVAMLPEKYKTVQQEHYWVPGSGCDSCTDGYKGRTGVFEAFFMDAKVEELLNDVTESPSEREVYKATRHQNIPTMSGDGILKVLDGTTSLRELQDNVAMGTFAD